MAKIAFRRISFFGVTPRVREAGRDPSSYLGKHILARKGARF